MTKGRLASYADGWNDRVDALPPSKSQVLNNHYLDGYNDAESAIKSGSIVEGKLESRMVR